MKTILVQPFVLDEKKYCQECARWQLLTDQERELIGVPEFISVGRCSHGQMMEDIYECIFLHDFLPIIEQTCYTCADERCKQHGKINQGCAQWNHQLARFTL